MKILLIRPPYTRLRKTGQLPYFPLGIGYVAGMLEKHGFEVAIYNAENPTNKKEVILRDERDVFNYRSLAQVNYLNAINNDGYYVWKEVRETLRMFRPDAVGLSLLTVEYPAAVKISKICKEYKRDMPVIWGGFHPTSLPESCLKNKEVDIVVSGEGEITAVELFETIMEKGDVSKVQGIYIRKRGGGIHYTGVRQLIQNLDEIPFPARHLRLYPETYDPMFMGSLITSRGCPYRCTFCGCRNLWQKKFRRRTPANVIREMKELIERYKTNHVFFMDDTFSLDKKSGLELCKEIVRGKVNIVWTTGTRVDKVDDELIKTMKKAGCVYIDLGIESGSERMSKIIKKDITKEEVHNAVKIINRHGLASGAFFMAGLLEETYDDLEDTFAMIKSLKTTHIALNVWDPMPGSDLYDQAVEMGIISRDADFNNFPLWPDSHFAIYMEPQEFARRCNEMAEWIYNYNNTFYSRYRKVKPKVVALCKRDPKFLFYRLMKHIKERFARTIYNYKVSSG